MTEEEWNDVINIHLNATKNSCSAAWKYMKE